jgi:hypothetical protein
MARKHGEESGHDKPGNSPMGLSRNNSVQIKIQPRMNADKRRYFPESAILPRATDP